MEDWSRKDLKFRYMMLDRLRQDCEYCIRNNFRSGNSLWAGNAKNQIANMKAIWNTFAEKDTPEWLTWDDILKFEEQMKNW